MVHSFFRIVQHWVSSTQIAGNPSVGLPSAKQARDALVQARGERSAAVDILHGDRTKKVLSVCVFMIITTTHICALVCCFSTFHLLVTNQLVCAYKESSTSLTFRAH